MSNMLSNTAEFEQPPTDPIPVFNAWFATAQTVGLPNPNAMTLATVDDNGYPSARIVLLKDFDREGAVFFTNRLSQKGRALAAHPRAALLFHWDILDVQIRIAGAVIETTDAESDEYFQSRRRESRINAWASNQSEPIANRAALEARAVEITRKYHGIEIPRPPHWGGYRVALELIEFWRGDKFRLHDRVRYTRIDDGSYRITRLCP